MNFIENIVENQSSTIKEYERIMKNPLTPLMHSGKKKQSLYPGLKNFLKLKKVLLTIR